MAYTDVCKKDQQSANALSLLQVSHSAETNGAHRSLAQVVAEEEAQLDAMASEMSSSDEGQTTSAQLDSVGIHQPDFQTAPGVYETRLETLSTVDGAADDILADNAQPKSFAPVTFSEYTAAKVTAAPPSVVAKPSGVGAGDDTCDPACDHGHGLCHNGICLCRSPYIGETCQDVDLRATRHLAAVRSVKMLTSNPGAIFMLLSEVPLMLAMLVVILGVAAAVLFATFCAHVFLNINEKSDDTFAEEENIPQEGFHEAWLRGKKQHTHAS